MKDVSLYSNSSSSSADSSWGSAFSGHSSSEYTDVSDITEFRHSGDRLDHDGHTTLPTSAQWLEDSGYPASPHITSRIEDCAHIQLQHQKSEGTSKGRKRQHTEAAPVTAIGAQLWTLGVQRDCGNTSSQQSESRERNSKEVSGVPPPESPGSPICEEGEALGSQDSFDDDNDNVKLGIPWKLGTQSACLYSECSLSMDDPMKMMRPERSEVDTEESSLWSDYSDSDFDNAGGDFATLEPLKDCFIRQIMVIFAVSRLRYISQRAGYVDDSGGTKSTQCQSQNSSPNGDNSDHCNYAAKQPVSSRFRKASGAITDDGGQGNPPRPGKRRRVTPDEQKEDRFLACPFCKNNPLRYLSCYSYIIRDISRLK